MKRLKALDQRCRIFGITRLFWVWMVFVASPCMAADWTSTLAPRSHLPAVFMAVDKNVQRIFLLHSGQKTPRLERVKDLVCTTGQRDGDKIREGDLKTPEGVYFIEEKISSGLDFTLYGNTAFPLNYPNPIDRVHGKKGYGIWIHGRGTPLTPKQTRGCVALQNPVVDTLDQHITLRQTPVIIAQRLDWTNSTGTAPENILQGTWVWINTRERRDDRLFSLYDAKLMAKSTGKPFEHFMQAVHTEFKKSSWTDIRNGPIQILEGPGYTVSFFSQRTMTATTATEGWRRLYWMRSGDMWKIAGEEWIVGKTMTHDEYARTVEQEIQTVVRKAELAWEKKDWAVLHNLYARAMQDGRLDLPEYDLHIGTSAPNPFTGNLQVVLAAHGVEAHITQRSGVKRTFVFLPAKFDSWALQPARQSS